MQKRERKSARLGVMLWPARGYVGSVSKEMMRQGSDSRFGMNFNICKKHPFLFIISCKGKIIRNYTYTRVLVLLADLEIV